MNSRTGFIHDEFKVVTPFRYVNVLPDGNIITVGVKRFLHVEVLFQPNVIGEGVKSTTLLFGATRRATFTSARILMWTKTFKMSTSCRKCSTWASVQEFVLACTAGIAFINSSE